MAIIYCEICQMHVDLDEDEDHEEEHDDEPVTKRIDGSEFLRSHLTKSVAENILGELEHFQEELKMSTTDLKEASLLLGLPWKKTTKK